MSSADVGPTGKRLLNPELFQLHFATFLRLLFPFATFLIFLLVCDACTSVFKFDLCSYTPSLAEVIPKIDDCMWNVETSMTGVILVFLWLTVATNVVTIKITGKVGLSISSHTETGYFFRLMRAVSAVFLRMACQTQR